MQNSVQMVQTLDSVGHLLTILFIIIYIQVLVLKQKWLFKIYMAFGVLSVIKMSAVLLPKDYQLPLFYLLDTMLIPTLWLNLTSLALLAVWFNRKITSLSQQNKYLKARILFIFGAVFFLADPLLMLYQIGWFFGN